MAKKKLTVEDVLVPKDEIPYEVPENWCWIKLGSIVLETSSGFACAKRYEVSEDDGDAYPHLRPNNIGYYGKLNLDKVVYIPKDKVDIKKSTLEKGTILFNNTNSTELVGRSILIEDDIEYAFSNHITRIVVNKEICSPEWLNYAINYNWVQGLFARICKQWVGQSGVNQDILNKEVYIPIPPLAEQERIINRIESLFDKVDKAADLVDEAREGFEKRRAAILEMAFSGELTKKWREENGVSDEWNKKKLSDVCEIIMGQSPKGSSYNDLGEGVPLINGPVEFGQSHFSKTIKSKWTTQPTKMCKELDLLLCVRGSTLGRINIAGFEACIGRGVAAIRAKDDVEQMYVDYKIHSMRNDIYNIGTGTTFPNISSQQIKDIEIDLPILDEQKRIINILDELLCSEAYVEDLTDINNNIDIIKKSILAKAFRGELGSNDLDEESGINLLEKLIEI